ncbi:MAG: hypothetical protein KDI46_05335 [Alphaproteobacteria bacterium]|nr:hypothetical protein [Alphaproteobacteria bacterium]
MKFIINYNLAGKNVIYRIYCTLLSICLIQKGIDYNMAYEVTFLKRPRSEAFGPNLRTDTLSSHKIFNGHFKDAVGLALAYHEYPQCAENPDDYLVKIEADDGRFTGTLAALVGEFSAQQAPAAQAAAYDGALAGEPDTFHQLAAQHPANTPQMTG